MINIQNIDDNECFKWWLVKYLNPVNHHPVRITKADKDFAKMLDVKDIILQSKWETFTKSKTRIPLALAFLVIKNKEKYPIYISKKCCKEKHVD